MGQRRIPERDYCILLLMYHHGLRVSELCDLRLDNIHLDNSTIYVRHQKSGGRGGRTHPSVHPLYKGDLLAVKEWLKIRQKMTLEHDFLFTSEQRARLSRASVWRMV